jgi:hypothetical protein
MQDNYDQMALDEDININNMLNAEGIFNDKNIPKIRVVVRKRPSNKKEIQKGDIDIIETRGSQTCIVKELK